MVSIQYRLGVLGFFAHPALAAEAEAAGEPEANHGVLDAPEPQATEGVLKDKLDLLEAVYLDRLAGE